jgi:hypothetical protein
MMFIEVEGTRDQIKDLNSVQGVERPRGGSDIGGGKYRQTVFITRKEAIAEIEARGLMVRVVLDEDEVKRRIEDEQRGIQRAKDAGASASPPSGDPAKGPGTKGTA